jgi:hypothetical protein
MAVPSSGVLKISDIATEFQDTVPYKLSKYYRGGALVPNSSQNANVPTSGAIKLGNFYGAVRRVTATQTFATNTTQTTLNVSALSGYVAGITDITITVNNGVYVYSTDVSSPALAISGATAGDTVTLVNNGFIIGKGGNGTETAGFNASNGSPGGPAMSLGNNISITNNSYIAGGGGGGGAGIYPSNALTGGGAGGGNGGGSGPNYYGGIGGGPGQAGAQGTSNQGNFPNYGGGGGGGRILPGVGGFGSVFQTKPGGGGAGGGSTVGGQNGGTAGSGGSGGSAGEDRGGYSAGGGGGWGARGGNGGTGNGGAGGKAINLNGYAVTYNVTGTVYGVVS